MRDVLASSWGVRLGFGSAIGIGGSRVVAVRRQCSEEIMLRQVRCRMAMVGSVVMQC